MVTFPPFSGFRQLNLAAQVQNVGLDLLRQQLLLSRVDIKGSFRPRPRVWHGQVDCASAPHLVREHDGREYRQLGAGVG